jgi:hypothetical protein
MMGYFLAFVAAAGVRAPAAATPFANQAAPLPHAAGEPADEFGTTFELSAGLDCPTGTACGLRDAAIFFTPVAAGSRGERSRTDSAARRLLSGGPANLFGDHVGLTAHEAARLTEITAELSLGLPS